jgi:hypothetical protein
MPSRRTDPDTVPSWNAHIAAVASAVTQGYPQNGASDTPTSHPKTEFSTKRKPGTDQLTRLSTKANSYTIELYAAVLRAVATHRVNNRPDRVEPRAVKRRPKKQVYMTEPRSIAKARLLNTT